MRTASRAIVPWLFTMLGACGKSVSVPATDASPPVVSLGIWHPNTSAPGLSINSSSNPSPPSPTTYTVSVAPNEIVTVHASAEDPESGITAVEIWATETKWKNQPGGVVTQSGPGLPGLPEAETTDNTGPTVSKSVKLVVQHDFDIPAIRAGYDRIAIEVWAKGANGLSMPNNTPVARIVWP